MNKQQVDISLRKKTIFSLVAVLGIWLLVELVLVVCGLGSVEGIDDPFVGFNAGTSLFVESEIDGQDWMRTAPGKQVWFNDQRFPRIKGANTKRVFCLGGSTTFGRPFDDSTAFSGWLRELFPLVDPETQWEIVNAGGVSYASYRVANVMEELCHYDPDLFIVFTGHNEFLERRTYAGLIDEEWNEERVIARVRHTLQASRLFNLLEKWMRPENGFLLEAKDELPAEVDEILNHSAGPKDYERDDQWQNNVLTHLKVNLGRMIQMARTVDAEILFVSPASNLRSCLPFKSVSGVVTAAEPSRAIEGTPPASPIAENVSLDRANLRSLVSSGNIAAALEQIDRGIEVDSRNADLLFFKGRCLFEMGEFGAAREAFLRAVDEDVCPLRATGAIRRSVIEICAANRAVCVDFDSILGEQSQEQYGHRCFGDEYFLDHVHPTVDAHGLLARSIIEQLQRSGWLVGQAVSTEMVDSVSRAVVSKIDLERQAIAFRNLAKVLHWAGKFEEAIPKAVDATRLLPDDLESYYVMADCLRQLGRNDEAYLAYQQLFAKGEYGRAYLPFGELLMELGRFDRAVEFLFMATLAPDLDHRVRAFYDLGYSHLQVEEYELALEALTECDRLASGEPGTIALMGEACFALGQLDKAEARFLQVIELGGDLFYANRRLAEICLETERPEAAKVYAKECLRLSPEDEVARTWLMELERDCQ